MVEVTYSRIVEFGSPFLSLALMAEWLSHFQLFYSCIQCYSCWWWWSTYSHLLMVKVTYSRIVEFGSPFLSLALMAEWLSHLHSFYSCIQCYSCWWWWSTYSNLLSLKSLTQELVRMYSMILKLKLLMTMISRGNTGRWWSWWWRFEDIWACLLMEKRIGRFKN